MHELIDIGANLTHDSFDRDREEVIRRAVEVGVTKMMVTGASPEGSRQAAELAASRPGLLYATAGVHPHHATDYDADTGELLACLLERDDVVAVGECGLDYFRNFSPVEVQKVAFAAQLDIAVACGKPVFLHQRDAHDDFVAILESRIGRINGGVAHCFTGGLAEMREYLDMGLYIGVTGWICDERRGLHLRELVSRIPADKLLLETDAPYLLPRTIRPRPKTRRNEPAWLPRVLETVAEARRVSQEELARQTTANAERFFDLPGDGG